MKKMYTQKSFTPYSSLVSRSHAPLLLSYLLLMLNILFLISPSCIYFFSKLSRYEGFFLCPPFSYMKITCYNHFCALLFYLKPCPIHYFNHRDLSHYFLQLYSSHCVDILYFIQIYIYICTYI